MGGVADASPAVLEACGAFATQAYASSYVKAHFLLLYAARVCHYPKPLHAWPNQASLQPVSVILKQEQSQQAASSGAESAKWTQLPGLPEAAAGQWSVPVHTCKAWREGAVVQGMPLHAPCTSHAIQ